MKIKIIDLDLFEKTNGIYFTRDSNFQYEYEVYAIEGKKQKEFLIYLQNLLFWCKENGSINLISNEINTNWIFVDEYEYKPLNLWESGIKLSNIYCYKWMMENKEFFYNIYEKNLLACELFLNITKMGQKTIE